MNSLNVDGLELTHLRYFVVLAEELHFGRAAARLHISQPPLTQQIQRLEARVGCTLLRRTSRRTELTAAGQVFYQVARGVLIEAQRALDATRRAARGETGQLTIATPPSLMVGVLPLAILRLRERFSAVDVRLREMASSRIVDALASGLADVGLIRDPRVPVALNPLFSWKEPVVAILPPGHPLAQSRRFAVRLLANEPFVFFARELGPGFYEELLQTCRSAGFQPRVVQEATQWSSVVGLVSAGVGVSICPASVTKLMATAVVTRPLPKHQTTVQLVRSSGHENPVIPHFVQIVRELCSTAGVFQGGRL